MISWNLHQSLVDGLPLVSLYRCGTLPEAPCAEALTKTCLHSSLHNPIIQLTMEDEASQGHNSCTKVFKESLDGQEMHTRPSFQLRTFEKISHVALKVKSKLLWRTQDVGHTRNVWYRWSNLQIPTGHSSGESHVCSICQAKGWAKAIDIYHVTKMLDMELQNLFALQGFDLGLVQFFFVVTLFLPRGWECLVCTWHIGNIELLDFYSHSQLRGCLESPWKLWSLQVLRLPRPQGLLRLRFLVCYEMAMSLWGLGWGVMIPIWMSAQPHEHLVSDLGNYFKDCRTFMWSNLAPPVSHGGPWMWHSSGVLPAIFGSVNKVSLYTLLPPGRSVPATMNENPVKP